MPKKKIKTKDGQTDRPISDTKEKQRHKEEPSDVVNETPGDGVSGVPLQRSFPVVGIGASAGGLSAIESFFSGMPAGIELGMAFILVQHLAPDHKSILTELIQRYTRMHVFEVKDGMVVEPNCFYIIPPGYDMAFLNGALQLLEPSTTRSLRLPIDFFFRSLAMDLREKAIAIVLSGSGSDGTLGVRAIKGEGGMVMAQIPSSTEHDGMPRSALATGLVDYELLPAKMPAQLISYVSHAYAHKPPATLHSELNTVVLDENAMKRIFVLLRAQVGHDFSFYKPNTIQRRIERRMAVNLIDTMDGYARYLQQTPGEVEALFRDLLIGVTSFFRDPEAFKVLEEGIIPKIFASKSEGGTIRVWVPGCSSGEEAYSIAILLQEHMESLKQNYKMQVFATDIDAQALATARSGIYPASIAADISPDRMARFLTADPGSTTLRIHPTIRDMVVFSEQDVVKDPPFSKIDLISCRNLMIYLGSELQRKLIALFHYVLLPGGTLFLGSSESVGECDTVFNVIDRKWKLYQRKDSLPDAERVALDLVFPPMTGRFAAPQPIGGKDVSLAPHSLREITEQALIEKVALAGVLVNGHGEILYVHGRTGLYLELATGESGVGNILKMAREGLQQELTLALRKAAVDKKPVCCMGLRVKTNGDFSTVHMEVRPVAAGPVATLASSLYLVVLENVSAKETSMEKTVLTSAGSMDTENWDKLTTDNDALVTALRRELRIKEEYLQTTNEELKSSNEEMQSLNEELQATNEELQTSKEELQSINEELATVNSELQAKVADLSRANNDMNNLLAGTGIGIVFVDFQLRILRFTPVATQIINLIAGDVGRPVSHIVSNLVGYDRLVEDVKAVLENLIPKECEVKTLSGTWYTLRILPYRTLNNVIEGAVITFSGLHGHKDRGDRKVTQEAT